MAKHHLNGYPLFLYAKMAYLPQLKEVLWCTFGEGCAYCIFGVEIIGEKIAQQEYLYVIIYHTLRIYIADIDMLYFAFSFRG